MEVLRFHSWAPNPRYTVWIDKIKQELRTVHVLTNGFSDQRWNQARANFALPLGATATAFL